MSNPYRKPRQPPLFFLIPILILSILFLIDRADSQSWDFWYIEKLARVDKVEKYQREYLLKQAEHQRKLQLYLTAVQVAEKARELYISSDPNLLTTNEDEKNKELRTLITKLQHLVK